ncbi:MAG TPA: methyltransferase domain-containing protein [Gemmatimonadaceae bacterium]|nr:methyltransferase domain-containing protein [Gemmatimonadaceae bacterium]
MLDQGSPSSRTTGRVIHWAARYDALVWLLTLGRERRFREKLIEQARLEAGETVLDAGCGTGSLAIVAKHRVGPSGSVSGIDPSPEMIARATVKARRAGVEVDFRTGVVEALQFPDAQFDVVLSTLMMHHLPRAARESCAREMSRVLKPGGRALVVDFGARPSGKKSFIGHIHRRGHVKLDAVVGVLTDAGLNVVESGAVGTRNLYFALATAS